MLMQHGGTGSLVHEKAAADFHAMDWRMVDGSRGEIQCMRRGRTSQ